MAISLSLNRCAVFCIVEIILCILVDAVRNPAAGQDGHSTASFFGQSITLVCNMNGRMNRQPMTWFYVDSQSFISRNDRLFPTLDEDRLNRYSAWIEPDLNQYMLRIDGLLIRDGGKFVCGYTDQTDKKFVPLWETTLLIFHPPEDNTLACDVTYLHSNAGTEDKVIEIACSWNIELLNVDIAIFQGRKNLKPDINFNGRMIRRMKVDRFARLNNYRCVMIYPDQNRQAAPCTLPQMEPRPVIHMLPLVDSVPAGTTTEFTCEIQNQRRGNLVWTPNCVNSPTLDVCKRITLVNGGSKMRISNPQLGDDGMLIQCSVVSPGGLMAAGVAQIRVESVPSTGGDHTGDVGLKGEHERAKGTDRGWTNPRGRSEFIPVTTFEMVPLEPTRGSYPEAEFSNRSVYVTIIPVVIAIVLVLLIGYTLLSRLRTVYKRKQRKETNESMDDHLFDRREDRELGFLSKDKVIDAMWAIPRFIQKARRKNSTRGKTAVRRPPLPVTTAWASRGSIPRAISPISITPDLFRTAPLMSASSTSISSPPKPPPKVITREEAQYQNTMPLRQVVEVPQFDPKLILVRPSKRYDFVRISNDIARGYTNLRPDAVLPRRCSITEDDYGYLVRSAKKHRRH